ncbi:hypothetical protein CCR94_06125 [Rhodoblastus sphagnicola]|uniref:Uncharacterized protein n=1 Tax=Rhodoblastus sphagnicola TaxID=333368 RepID=A0A2S6NCN9_9HYPH|nr:hypothetical protein [Rhodoblastus sphagnicola]MBB4199408.1 hypothetical protein [Rhodoblastus sphagnicola]PPQ32383.1 hypothetical protein CCR94_06125 [Rhodoblastus sphagnicola]
MQVEQGSGLWQGFETAGTEADARPRQLSPREGVASAQADGGVSPELSSHDFSNLAMTLLSAANLLQRYGDDPVRVAQIANLLRETGERAIAASRGPPPRA